IPDSIREPWKSLIAQCLLRNPAHRMSAEQIESFLRSDASVLRLPPAVPAPPSVVTVAQDGTGQYESIQAAIESVAPDAEIRVRPGKYRETLRIDRPLRLIGDGTPGEVIVSTRDARCLELTTDDDVYVRGFTFRTRPGPEN